MAQFLRPDSNITQTSFTGGFAEIDEATASDADLAWGADNTAAVLEVGLSNPAATPGAGTTTVRYRVVKTNDGVIDGAGNSVTGTLEVFQGGTLIASDVARTLTGAAAEYSFTPDMSGVTDWNDLRLRYTTSTSGGNPTNRRGGAITWVEIEAPDAAANTTVTVTAAVCTSTPQALKVSTSVPVVAAVVAYVGQSVQTGADTTIVISPASGAYDPKALAVSTRVGINFVAGAYGPQALGVNQQKLITTTPANASYQPQNVPILVSSTIAITTAIGAYTPSEILVPKIIRVTPAIGLYAGKPFPNLGGSSPMGSLLGILQQKLRDKTGLAYTFEGDFLVYAALQSLPEETLSELLISYNQSQGVDTTVSMAFNRLLLGDCHVV